MQFYRYQIKNLYLYNTGKLRRFVNFKKGFAFCGNISECKSAHEAHSFRTKEAAKNWNKEAAKAKRAKTNKEKYGVENIGQIEKARKTRAEIYSDKEKVQEITKKIQNTCQKRYGVKNSTQDSKIRDKQIDTTKARYGVKYAAQSQIIKNKTKNTNLKIFGTEYPSQNSDISQRIVQSKKETFLKKSGRNHEKQLHISEEAWNVLQNKEQFIELLTRLGRKSLAKKLGVSAPLISVTHHRHGLAIFKSNTSSGEAEIGNWLSKNKISYIKDNKICEGKELDFYIPSHNLAIEFDGLYWHSENKGKDKFYHANKTKMANEKGIRLIHIFEDEWIQHENICKSLLSLYLNLATKTIMARKCEIREITNQESKDFLDTNHLQGYTSATINLGLFYENELVLLMTFKVPRFNKKIQWELIRLCSKIDTRVVGGTKKLWAYFLKHYHPESVVSYCDRRWFQGNIYRELKFNFFQAAKPTYWYTDSDRRYHRSIYTKNKCIRYSLEVDPTFTWEGLSQFTEKYMAKNILKMDRIWDCGQDTWIWKKS